MTYQRKQNFSFMDSSEFDTTNDKYNWKLMKNGDQEALAELFRRYYSILFDYGFKICRREELVKDSIQEIFAIFPLENPFPAAVFADSIKKLPAIPGFAAWEYRYSDTGGPIKSLSLTLKSEENEYEIDEILS